MPALDAVLRSRTLQYHRDLLANLVARDFRSRYKDSVLGLAWAVINPLLQLLIFYFLFRLVFSLKIPQYASLTFVGLLAWGWFAGTLNVAVTAIKNNPDLVAQPGFPTAVLPVVAVATNFMNLLVVLPVLLVLLAVEGAVLNASLLLLPLIFAVQFVFTLGLAYLLAALNASYRDVQHLLAVALQLYFYVTPIFYALSSVPESIRPWYALNPMMHLVEAYRDVLVRGVPPSGVAVGGLALISALLLAWGYHRYQTASYHFLEDL